MATDVSTTQSVLDHHLEAFQSQDLEEIMTDYTDESTVVTNLGTFEGRAEIQGLFEDLFAEFDAPEASITMEETIVAGPFAYIVWNAETPENDYEFATDTFYVPDETIEFQSFAGMITPKA